MGDDFAAFVAELRLPDGSPFELAPFQARILEDLEAGDADAPWSGPAMLAARLQGRQDRAGLAIAVALLAGAATRSRIVIAGSEDGAQRILERAAYWLDRYAALFDLELPAPAAELVRVVGRQDTADTPGREEWIGGLSPTSRAPR